MLRGHKKFVGWTLANLPRINPSIWMHQILLEDDSKPIRQPQRRLNPTILDVVKKKVMKLLAIGIIYPISDSTWVSPVQVVPKKFGYTVVRNQDNKLIPNRVANNWQVCIDYRRLNQATCKDHFPLLFIDQVLERLAIKSHYCFLDGFLGYMQIHIALEDQHKTTFTYPFGTFAYTRMPFGLCNAPITFKRCMVSIFFDLLVSYPNFVRGLLLDDMQPLIGRFKILGTLCCTICKSRDAPEVKRKQGYAIHEIP